MVKGLAIFQEWFKGFEDQYVLTKSGHQCFSMTLRCSPATAHESLLVLLPDQRSQSGSGALG